MDCAGRAKRRRRFRSEQRGEMVFHLPQQKAVSPLRSATAVPKKPAETLGAPARLYFAEIVSISRRSLRSDSLNTRFGTSGKRACTLTRKKKIHRRHRIFHPPSTSPA